MIERTRNEGRSGLWLATLTCAIALALGGCPPPAATLCEADADCPDGETCVPASSGPGVCVAEDLLATDAGATADAGPTDAGATDSGPTDAGPTDAGPIDAGATDAGVDVDAGLDAGAEDGGALDAGDAGVDAGGDDAGAPSLVGAPRIVPSSARFEGTFFTLRGRVVPGPAPAQLDGTNLFLRGRIAPLAP